MSCILIGSSHAGLITTFDFTVRLGADLFDCMLAKTPPPTPTTLLMYHANYCWSDYSSGTKSRWLQRNGKDPPAL